MEYTLDEHVHRFSVWTAARASQRGFTSTLVISQVIESSKLRDFVESQPKAVSPSEFDEFHKGICRDMIQRFHDLGVTASYGRVAKIVAIYLKTSVVIRVNRTASILEVVHPPIDRIVLRALAKELKDLKKLNWTQMSFDQYWQLVETIRSQLGNFDWRLELRWRPEIGED